MEEGGGREGGRERERERERERKREREREREREGGREGEGGREREIENFLYLQLQTGSPLLLHGAGKDEESLHDGAVQGSLTSVFQSNAPRVIS